jgi:hypothetical protein
MFVQRPSLFLLDTGYGIKCNVGIINDDEC